MTRFLFVMVGLLGSACSCDPDPEVREAFTAAKTSALAGPAALGSRWAPDVDVAVSAALVRTLVQGAVKEGHGPWKEKIDVATGFTLTPDVVVEDVALAPSEVCAACFATDLRLVGTLAFSATVLGAAEIPLRVDTTSVVELATDQNDEGWHVTARVRSVPEVVVQVSGIPRALLEMGDESLREWVEAELLAMEPKVVASVPQRVLPLSALRVEHLDGGGLALVARTASVNPGVLPASVEPVEDGWRARVAPESLVSLLRTRMFEEGPRTRFKMVGEPMNLSVEGQALTLDFRVWRVAPPGWWRDMRATGTLKVEGSELVLAPDSVAVTGVSDGAGWNDPLAYVGESWMLDEVRSTLARSITVSQTSNLRGAKLEARATELVGSDGVLVVRGTLSVGPE